MLSIGVTTDFQVKNVSFKWRKIWLLKWTMTKYLVFHKYMYDSDDHNLDCFYVFMMKFDIDTCTLTILLCPQFFKSA